MRKFVVFVLLAAFFTASAVAQDVNLPSRFKDPRNIEILWGHGGEFLFTFQAETLGEYKQILCYSEAKTGCVSSTGQFLAAEVSNYGIVMVLWINNDDLVIVIEQGVILSLLPGDEPRAETIAMRPHEDFLGLDVPIGENGYGYVFLNGTVVAVLSDIQPLP